jgi:hypothetical protein
VSGDSVVEQEGCVVASACDLLGRKPGADEEAVLPVSWYRSSPDGTNSTPTYRRTNRVTTDGEVVPCFKQKKSQLRKGDRITLFHLMKGLHFPELAAAGGEGTDIMRKIKRAPVRVRKSRR